jgi:riboflavin kinase/FMN adenylyltransferase
MLLEKMGLDYLIIHPFSKEFSRLTALDFVRDILVNKLNTSKVNYWL